MSRRRDQREFGVTWLKGFRGRVSYAKTWTKRKWTGRQRTRRCRGRKPRGNVEEAPGLSNGQLPKRVSSEKWKRGLENETSGVAFEKKNERISLVPAPPTFTRRPLHGQEECCPHPPVSISGRTVYDLGNRQGEKETPGKQGHRQPMVSVSSAEPGTTAEEGGGMVPTFQRRVVYWRFPSTTVRTGGCQADPLY